MSNLYKVDLNGNFEGVHFKNVLWYASNVEAATGFTGDLIISSAEAIARSVQTHVWNTHWKNVVPTTYTLDNITVYPYNDVFELIYQLPYVLTVNETGTVTDHPTLPPACTANLKFNLRPNLIDFPGFPAPKRGWVKIGPVLESYVNDDGTLSQPGYEAYANIANHLAEWLPWDFIDVEIPLVGWEASVGIPLAFEPKRVRVWTFSTPQIIGGDTFARFINTASILSCAPNQQTGYARSRRVEA